jgi:hypothetical protein
MAVVAQQLQQFYSYDGFNQPQCTIGINNYLYCHGFNSWQQVSASLNATDLTYLMFIVIKAPQPRLTHELDIEGWLAKYPSRKAVEINIYGLEGVEVLGWRSTTRNYKNNMLVIHASSVRLYADELFPAKYTCNAENVENLANHTLFNYFYAISFAESVKYDCEAMVWCPYMFANSKTPIMGFQGLFDSFLLTNLFKFQHTISSKNTSFKSINSSITELDLQGYNYILDESIMNTLVFEIVQSLKITNTIRSIQSDLFHSFKLLNNIQLNMFSLNDFFHRIDIQWASYLNPRTVVTFSELIGAYTYPSSDLCLFATFPFQNSVLPILDSNLSACTDTLAWLTQTYGMYNVATDSDFTDNAQQIYSLCWLNKSFEPNFTLIDLKFTGCLLSQSNGPKQQQNSVYVDSFEIEFVIQFILNLIAFVCIPFACIVGLLLNLRVVWTVQTNSTDALKEEFYQYMAINSIFNCLYCVIFSLYPINYCLKYETGYFCSSIHSTIAAQVIKIVFMSYLGEAVKMCSNISYIFITVNRYMLVGQKHSVLLEKISKWKMKYVISVTVLFSLFMNIGHVFQYRINYGLEMIREYYTEEDVYPHTVIYNPSFEVYAIVYFMINFVLFLLLNTWLEVVIVSKLQQEISDKKAKTEMEIKKMNLNNSAQSDVVNKVVKMKQKKIEQDAKKEQRAIVMVIANSLLNFILRLPEIFILISDSNGLFLANAVWITFNSIINFSNITVTIYYLAYILTFTTNVLVYYMFNQNFKQHFAFWTTYVKKK